MDTAAWANVERLMVVGDTHANTSWLVHVCDMAVEHDCDLILQVGDFGYFPNLPEGRHFLAETERRCAAIGVGLAFIDGNHDDHTELSRLRRNRRDPVLVSPHVTYLPRGCRTTIGGRTFGFLGGAFSIDWRVRVPGTTWWPTEIIDDADVEALGTGPLDVLVTHDAPSSVPLSSSLRLPAADEARSYEQRELIDEAVRATEPELLLHGHWHHAYEHDMAWVADSSDHDVDELAWRSAHVVGLDCDGHDDSWLTLDLPGLTLDR